MNEAVKGHCDETLEDLAVGRGLLVPGVSYMTAGEQTRLNGVVLRLYLELYEKWCNKTKLLSVMKCGISFQG